MKQNSCVLLAVDKLVQHQFGETANVDAFDKFNDGRGVRIEDLPRAIEGALPSTVGIDTIYVCGEVDDWKNYNCVNVAAERTVIPSPNLALVEDDHLVACLPGDTVSCSAVITLRRR